MTGIEARTIDNIRLPTLDRFDQIGDLRRIIFEVGVLNEDRITRSVRDCGPDRGTLPPIVRPNNEASFFAGYCRSFNKAANQGTFLSLIPDLTI